MTEIRSVKEIQAALMTAAEDLEATTKRLRLVELMTELERNYPPDIDAEGVGDGVVCPPVAWEIHADVGNARILLEEVMASLHKASRRTKRDVRRQWVEEKLEEIDDPAIRSLLAFISDSVAFSWQGEE